MSAIHILMAATSFFILVSRASSEYKREGIYKLQEREIPLNFIRQLNNVSDIWELFENLKDRQSEKESSGLVARMGHEGSSIKESRMANCIPELRTVSLKPDLSRTTFYYPSCTRVERCGGCCSHHLLSCQPVETEYFFVTIIVADYLGGRKLHFRGQKVIKMERHKKCKCDCKIRPQDCTRYQRYNPDKCQCECDNDEDERRCNGESSMKIWSKENCSCMCREEMECWMGSYFDPFTCSCRDYRDYRKKLAFLYDVN